jgi:hypothetical protein
MMSDDEFLSNLPASFGGASKEVDVAAQLERCRRAKPPPAKKSPSTGSKSDSDSDGDSDSDDDEDDYPTTHEMVLRTHERAVTTVSLDLLVED